MKPPNAEQPPLDELLKKDDPEGYFETLSILFEAWNGSEYSNGTSPEQRSLILTRFKSLRLFLYRVRERKSLTATDEKDNVWIS